MAGQSATDPIPFIWKILRPSGRPPWLCPWSSIADRPLSGKTGELASFGGGAGHWHRCLSPLDWITDMRQTLHADAAALDAVLARHGFIAIGDFPLFRLIQTAQAAVLFANLSRH